MRCDLLHIVKRSFTRCVVGARVLVLAVVENTRRKQLAWVNAILDVKNWNQFTLAKEAGVHHSTLSKFLSDEQNIQQLSTRSVEKIAALNILPPYETKAPVRQRGLAEGEASPYTAFDGDELSIAIAAMRAGRNGVDPWVLNSRALETAGYLPGDVLIVDLNGEPKSGDVVCAQVYDRTGRPETVFRLYEPPFLAAASLDRQLMRPILLGDNAVVRGVVEASLRPRRSN
jgi:transcriptional regulator with XRE-family HTH domain